MKWFLGVVGLYFFFFSIYLSFIFFIGAFFKKRDNKKITKFHNFAIVIPAHNEASIISKTLENIQRLDYPLELYTIFVIADNCTDNTADIVRKLGIICLERNEKEKRGKGFALQWFFEKILKSNWQFDAFVIIDADTIVSKNFLKSMNIKLNLGNKVLTSWGGILNPEMSPTLMIGHLARFLRNIKSKGKSILGCNVPFRGNGLCISYEIVKKYGWKATSITEDREYWAMLHLKGIKGTFVNEVSVLSYLPKKISNYGISVARWDIGEIRITKKFLLPFVKLWLKHKTFTNFEAILELLSLPFTYFLDLLVIFFCLCWISLPHYTFIHLFYLISLSLMCLVIFLTLKLANLNLGAYKHLLTWGIFILIWRPWNFLKRYRGKSRTEWLRTKREEGKNKCGNYIKGV